MPATQYTEALLSAIIERIDCNVHTAMAVRAMNHQVLRASRQAWEMKCFTCADPKKMYLTDKPDEYGGLLVHLEISHPDHVDTAKSILEGTY